MRIVQRMALFGSLYYSERVRGTYAHVCESETVGGRAQVLPLTMQHNGARGSARRRAARRRASGSEWPPSPRLRDLAVVELGRPPGAGGTLRKCGRLSVFAVGPGVTVSASRPHLFARGSDKASEDRA